MTFFPRPPRTVVCPCGQRLGNERAADGYKRCTWCVERYAKMTEPKARKTPKAQSHLFDKPSPLRLVREGDKPPPPPSPPPPTSPKSDATAELVAELRKAKTKADHDPQTVRLRALRAAGKSLSEALAIIDQEQEHDP